MPTTDRYVLNELQQATLDVMAANVMPGDDEDLSRSAMTREEIIAGVQAVPGQDEVNGNHMGPTLACLKRRGLVKEASWPAKGRFHITPMGITYVDLDGEPEAEWGSSPSAPPVEQVATFTRPESGPAPLAPEVLSRDDLLTKLAMELGAWPESTLDELPEGWVFKGPYVGVWGESTPDSLFSERQWLDRRAELINEPSWDDAPEWAQWLAQDSYGGWWWYDQKPVSSDHDGSFDAPGQVSEATEGTIPAGHDWRETLEARPVTQAHSPGASSTACDDQHRPEPAELEAELETDLLATRDAIVGMEHALEELDDARPRELNPITSSLTNHQAEERALEEGTCSDGSPCGTPPSPGDDAYCLGCPNYAEDSDHAADPARPAPEVTILSVAVHPPGTAWLDSQETVIVKVDDLGAGPFLSLTTDGGPPTIESLAMLEAVTNTAFSLLREAEGREVAQ